MYGACDSCAHGAGCGAGSAARERHRGQLDDASLKRGLNLVWFSTGRDDRLLDTTTATVDLLKRHGFAVTYEESAGGHTWINWREYLNKFAPALFQK